MKKTAFITGITGQDGSYLAEFLLKKNYQVVGLISGKYDIGFNNIKNIQKDLKLEPGDLLEKSSLQRIINKHKPQEIYNLAGLTFVPASWEKPSLTLDINTLGLARILEIIRDNYPKTKIYQATSAKIFGHPPESPQTETTIISPIEPYGISKAASYYLIQSFRQQFNLFAVSGILYNHESPRRGHDFVSRKITIHAAKIKLGLAKKLTLGNLDSQQDWGYAPDYIEAMWLMLQQKNPQDYIIASGQLHSVRQVCQTAFSYLNLDYKKFVRIDKKFFRKTEAKATLGDVSKAKKVLNWQPKTNFKKMIEIMVDHDLNLLKKGEKI